MKEEEKEERGTRSRCGCALIVHDLWRIL